ncbi:MAG: HAD family hydrolase [Candidatus Thorarchaeota archaeon]
MTIKLVVFDVDGTLTMHSSIWWRLHELFNRTEEGKMYYDQYFAGEITYDEWANFDADLWAGKPLSEVMRIVKETELVPGAEDTVRTLKEHGIKVAILSGGLDLLADDIAERLGIDYVLTNRLEHRNGVLTGKVEVLVGWGEKVNELEQIVEHFSVTFDETAFIGDGRNDIGALSVSGLSFAFNPEDEEVAKAAQIVIKKMDLREILNHIPL